MQLSYINTLETIVCGACYHHDMPVHEPLLLIFVALKILLKKQTTKYKLSFVLHKYK